VELKPHRMSTVLTITLWDKDTLGRDYMGEVNIPLQHMFTRNCKWLPCRSHWSVR
jgi:hypothetical protein